MALLRLLIVDDSAVYRQALQNIVATIPGVICIGQACDGKEAIDMIITDKPDVVTLDMEMPVMSGVEVIKAVTAKKLQTTLIIVSACSQSGAEVAINALKLGAYDFITKPNRLGRSGAKEDLRRQLIEKLDTLKCGNSRVFRSARSQSAPVVTTVVTPVKKQDILKGQAIAPLSVTNLGIALKAVVMGCSTGGPKALLKLFSGLQSPLDVPIFVVQHMPPMFTKTLAVSIDEMTTVSVKEAEDGDKPQANHAYIAPGGRQMKLVQGSAGIEIKITDDEPENFCKPSVDYFFSSVAEVYESRALGVILSGMGGDGCAGLRKMKHCGATVLGQDEASCVVYGMPRVAQEAGLVDQQITIDNMAAAIEGFLMTVTRGATENARY